MKRYYFYCIVLFAITTFSCDGKINKSISSVEMRLTHIEFDCSVTNEAERDEWLEPFEMFFTVDVKNISTDTISFGSYKHRYDLGRAKYGYFQMIYEQDTINLNSKYTSSYDLEPGQKTDFRLDYEGSLLIAFNTGIKEEEIELLKRKIETIRLRYVALPMNQKDLKYPIIDSIYNNIQCDSIAIWYLNNGNCKLAIDKFGDRMEAELL